MGHKGVVINVNFNVQKVVKFYMGKNKGIRGIKWE